MERWPPDNKDPTTKGTQEVISDLKLISNPPLLTEGVEGLCYEAALRAPPRGVGASQPAAASSASPLLSLSPSLPPLSSLLLRLSSSTGKHKLSTRESTSTFLLILVLL